MALPLNPDDTVLTALLQEDDEAAFAEIFRRYAGQLTAFATGKLNDLEAARDIVQDVFVNLWDTRHTLQIQHSLKAYLFALARYRTIDYIRKNINQEKYAAMAQKLYMQTYPDGLQQLEGKELQQRINKALDGLSPRVREVYLLSREKNLGTREIADMLQTSEQTVKNQLVTALNHIRQHVPGPLFILLAVILPH